MHQNRSIRKHLFFALLSLSLCNICAQSSWRNVDSLFMPLPSSIHVFYAGDSLDGKPNTAYYVMIPLRDQSIHFDADTSSQRGLTPSQYYLRNNNPLVVVNCSFFSMEMKNLNIIIDEGKIVAYNLPSVFSKNDSMYNYITRSAIGIDKQRRADVAWVYTDTARKKVIEFTSGPLASDGNIFQPSIRQLKKDILYPEKMKLKSWRMQTAVGGGPALISDGEIEITNEEELMFTGKALYDKHPRTAMGYTADGYLIILVIEGRNPGKADGATLLQEAVMLKELGCVEALNLDGGGSSCMLINGKETITPSDKTGQRPIPAVFLVKTAEGEN